MKTFALVDCNNFYCSCERLFRPDLKNRPVAVLSNNDGCIIARSREVKELGIRMGTPYFTVRDLIRRHGIEIFSSNYPLYDSISTRVMQTLEQFTPRVEIYSIDEAFLDLSGFSDLTAYGQTIRETVHRHVGVSVCVGIGPTKTLAKLASYAAKKYRQTGGVVDLTGGERQQRLRAITPVGEVWGIGRRHRCSLEKRGITTAAHLAALDCSEARARYSVVMERTVRELNGESCIDLEEIAPPKKQIVCSRSFGGKITQYQPLREALCEFAARAAEKLRRERQRARILTVFIRTSPYDKAPYYANAATGSFHDPTSDSREIILLATRLFGHIYKAGYCYARAGVMLGDFCPAGQMQRALLQQPFHPARSDRLMKTIDQINGSGNGTIWFGGQQPKKGWFMKQEFLSPTYTTRWESLPRVQ